MATVLDRLKSAMREQGLSQTDLARAAGLDPSTVNKILNGSRSPGLRAALALEEATGIPAREWAALPASVSED